MNLSLSVLYHLYFCIYDQVIKDPDLRERQLGDLQGLTLAEAAKSKVEAYNAIKSSKRDKEIPVSSQSIPPRHG